MRFRITWEKDRDGLPKQVKRCAWQIGAGRKRAVLAGICRGQRTDVVERAAEQLGNWFGQEARELLSSYSLEVVRCYLREWICASAGEDESLECVLFLFYQKTFLYLGRGNLCVYEWKPDMQGGRENQGSFCLWHRAGERRQLNQELGLEKENVKRMGREDYFQLEFRQRNLSKHSCFLLDIREIPKEVLNGKNGRAGKRAKGGLLRIEGKWR